MLKAPWKYIFDGIFWLNQECRRLISVGDTLERTKYYIKELFFRWFEDDKWDQNDVEINKLLHRYWMYTRLTTKYNEMCVLFISASIICFTLTNVVSR